ncbi:MAG TPA: RIP metalloprotease RseP [Castellaniella sp.]|uniref:RIP metalloprotease RseP n=1 Tax=Castellaniella sp. TaxID=1955812 RepID=UPI002F25560B
MLLTLLAFAVALGVLVVFHEWGHYLVARWCGVPVLRFSVGFGPVLLRRVDRRGTEWVLSALPLGGYVKMLDDAPIGAAPEVARKVFNRQPLWRRVAVVLAGPAANLLLAAVLYAVLGMWGSQEPVAVLATPPAHSPAAEATIAAGSVLTTVDGAPVESWTQARWRLMEPLALGGTVTLGTRSPEGVDRIVKLQVPGLSHASAQGTDPLSAAGLMLASPVPVVGTLTQGGAAQAAGLEPEDQIRSVGDLSQPTVQQFVSAVQEHAGKKLSLTVWRHGALVPLVVTPRPEQDAQGRPVGRIGALIQAQRPQVLVREGLLDSIATGVRRTAQMSALTLRMLGRMVVGESSWRNISGPVTIAEYAGQTARLGLEAYLGFLALISISIGVLNLLPIPMLDGGHLLFYVIEALRGGRPVSARVRDVGLRLGLATVVGLTVLALFNDFERLFS